MRFLNLTRLAFLLLLATSLGQAQYDLFEKLPWNAAVHGQAVGFDKQGPRLVSTGAETPPSWFHGHRLSKPAMRLPCETEMIIELPVPENFNPMQTQVLLVAKVIGTTGPPGKAQVVLNGQTSEIICTTITPHPMRSATVLSVPKGDGYRAIDGNPRSFWGTGYKHAKDPTPPFPLVIDLGRPRRFHGFEILPGMPHYTEGMPLEYGLLISEDGKTWEEIASGTYTYKPEETVSGGPRPRKTIEFGASYEARYIRLETRKLVAMNQVNIREFELLFDSDSLPSEPHDSHLVFLHLPASQLASATQKGSLEIRIESKGDCSDLVLADLRAEVFPAIPTRKNENKPNGRSGPDRIGLGMLGFDALTVRGNAGLALMQVIQGSPASKAGLQAGDLIIAVDGYPLTPASCNPGWQWFYRDPEAVLGRACAAALARTEDSVVRIEYFRDGQRAQAELDLKLWKLSGRPDGRFPLGGPLADEFEQELIHWIVQNQKPNGSWGGEIQTCFAVLGLLGTRDPQHAEAISRAIDWAIQQAPIKGGLSFWGLSFNGIMQCEYYLATGDPRVLPWIERCINWMPTTSHTSKWQMPCFGHGPGGLPYGQKALMAPLAHMLVFEALAERCGIDVKDDRGEPLGLWEIALPYCLHSWSDPQDGGHGAMGYNASFKDLDEFWSRSGLFATTTYLRDTHPEIREALGEIMFQRHPWMRNSHAYGAPGNVLGLLGLHLADPQKFELVMSQWGWSFLGAWHPGKGLRWSMPHMGAPYMGEDVLIHPMYLTLLSTKRKGLHISGARDRNWLSLPAAVRSQQVMGRRLVDGRISLTSAGSPEHIVYTTDGSEPTSSSNMYSQPFKHAESVWLRFRAINDGQAGPIQEAILPTAPPQATIIRASGSKDHQLARRNASAAIDNDPASVWSTDRGQLASGYPHSASIDFNHARIISKIQIHPDNPKNAPAEIAIRFSDDGESWTEGEIFTLQGDGKSPENFALKRVTRARFAEFKALSPKKPGESVLMLRELKFLGPEVSLVRSNEGQIRLEVPRGLIARYTLDGSPPHKQSSRYQLPFRLEDQGILTVDLFTAKGTRINRQIFDLR